MGQRKSTIIAQRKQDQRSLVSTWVVVLATLELASLIACGAREAPQATTQVTTATGSPQVEVAQTAPTIAKAESGVEPADDSFAHLRQEMVKQQLIGRDIADEKVLAAMTNTPRHEFVPADYVGQAYNDHPLPIGFGQTISQPYIVALMTELIELQPGEKVLEIGSGSGYQAAILAQLTDQVYTIEIIPALAERAQATFERLGYDQIRAKQADGYWGWEESAPFDAIIVTAAPDHIPQPLVNQLADGGKMVIPVGPPGGYQSLWILERQGEEVTRRNWGGVIFVPLTRSE